MKLLKSENRNVEFKRSWHDDYLKWICAFANTEGGSLYIGVEDNGEVYAHKIRIWNIGKMPEEVPVEKLFESHPSEPRNPNIANVFFKAGYVESWGRGYKNIADICAFRKAVLPVPQENSGGLMVECLPSEKYLEAEFGQGRIVAHDTQSNTDEPDNCTEIAQKLPRNCPEIAQKTLLALINNPKASIKALSVETGLSERTIKYHLKLLKDGGFIERVGSDRSGYWSIIDPNKTQQQP